MVGKRAGRRAGGRKRRTHGFTSAEERRCRKYRLTAEQYRALVKNAAGRCAICDFAFGDDFHVDHCHETGAVRGLLCNRCNYGLGWLDDSPPRVLAAYMYLKANGKSDTDWRHRGA